MPPELLRLDDAPRHLRLADRREATVEDVTECARLREQLSFSERMACVGRLAGGVAHGVNNPLAYVGSNIAFVAGELASPAALADPARLAEMKVALAEALTGVERISRIVRDLQTFVRSDDFLDGTVDLPAVLQPCLNVTHSQTTPRAEVDPAGAGTSVRVELPSGIA